MDQDPKPQGTDEQAQPQGAVQGASLQTTDQQAGPKFRWWRLLVILLVGSGLAVATYMIAPSIAWSESASKEVLVDSQRQLQHAVSGQVRLAKDLARLRKEHATALENVEKWEVADKAGQAKLTAANESIAQMSEQLKEAQQAGEPLREKVAAAELALSEAKTEAEEAKGRSKELVAQLASAADSAKQLSGRHQVLLADNAKLKSGMQARRTDEGKLRDMLSMLDLGPSDWSSDPSGRAEMPITRWELARCLGQPTLSFAKGRVLTIRWGKAHTARTVDDVVTDINGKPACRETLSSAAGARPWSPSQPGQWRLSKGEPVHYVDLVAMFGKPDKIGGSAARFQACWTVGAWARVVSATVVNGVVTEFGGRETDGVVCSELARHRSEAYESATPAVKVSTASARDCYRHACRAIAQQLRDEANLLARNGLRLEKHSVAPFESVGVWIAPSDASGDAMTVRAAVDCTWVKQDGTATEQRRYVVVIFAGSGGKREVSEFAVLTPGE